MLVRSDPFRDEIAIDFPSAGRFVERLREAFVSEGAPRLNDALQAEVSISPEDAYRGAVLTVDLTLPGTCADCGGRGESWAEPCVECHGRGDARVPYVLRVTVPPGVADGARLRLRVRPPHAAPVRVEVTIAIRNLSH